MTDIRQYRIEADSAEGLVRNVEEGIANGALAPGERLPSIRRLAVDVGLSPATVAAGLAELRRRGVVVSEPRRGSRIGEGPPIGSSRPSLPVPAGAVDLSRGNPDPALLPDLQHALARLKLPVRLYGERADVPELQALARERLRADGIPGDCLCVVSGALDGIERVLAAHLRPGDRVAVENPGYAALFDLLRARGLALAGVGIDAAGMRPTELHGALTRGARAVIITPRGQNPTGAALDERRARQLRRVLAPFPAVLVIEDDHLGPVAGCELHTTVTGRVRWAATRSVAKSLGPDLRVAVLTGDSQTVARVRGLQQCGPGWVSHILQRLVLDLSRDRSVATLVRRASGAYADRREGLLARLRDRGLAATGASGLNVWVPVDDETAVVSAMLARGWVLAPGAAYRLPGSSPAIRITIATLHRRQAERLVTDLADVLAPSDSNSRTG